MAPTVDRTFVKLVAYKRIATGIASLVGGAVMIALALSQGRGPTPLLAVAVLIFLGGGGWTLRDGVRTLAMLRKA